MTQSIKEEQLVDETPPIEQLVMAIPASIPYWREQFIKYLTLAEVPSDKTEME